MSQNSLVSWEISHILFCLAMLQLRTTLSGNPTVKACTVAGCALLLSNGAKSVQPTSSRHGRLGRLMDMTSKRIEMEWFESPDRENKPEEDTIKTKIAGVIELRTSTDTGLVHLHGSTCCGMKKLAVQQESCSVGPLCRGGTKIWILSSHELQITCSTKIAIAQNSASEYTYIYMYLYNPHGYPLKHIYIYPCIHAQDVHSSRFTSKPAMSEMSENQVKARASGYIWKGS